MQNYERTVLIWLLPSEADLESLPVELSTLTNIITDTRFFTDRDECIGVLPSIVDETIFLVLGTGQSDLVNILSTFPYVRYIYLSEPHNFTYTSQVRGVFAETKQLLQQLTIDVKIVQSSDTHLSVSSSGDCNRLQTSMYELRSRGVEFKWTQVSLDILLRMPKPTKNIFKDLLNECRFIHRNNSAQTQLIDEFEKEYEPSKAIWWYTRDSFLYRLINMALRTKNIMIILKFRFIIQDIYQQLKVMHEEQRNTLIGRQQRVLTVYHGQLISLMELEQLKNSAGDLIAMTSFVSTTKSREVAIQYAGYGEHPPDYKSVIFEICIDESIVGDEQLPFADISQVSHFKEEDEVLLCMSTVMRIDSVELRDQITWIRLCMCRRDVFNLATSNLDLWLNSLLNWNDENRLLFVLGMVFFLKGDYETAEQAMNMVKPFTDPVMELARQMYSSIARIGKIPILDVIYNNRLRPELCEVRKLLQSLVDLIPPGVDLPYAAIQSLQHMNKIFDAPLTTQMIGKGLCDAIRHMLPQPEPLSPDSMTKEFVQPFVQMKQSMHNSVASMTHDELKSKADEILPETGLPRTTASLPMLVSIVEEGSSDRAIEYVRDTLLKTSNDSLRINLYTLLIIAYRSKKDWPAVIECCQNIIPMPQLAPNSASIVIAHMDCGDAFLELGDLSEALLSYTNALELQHQHHPPQHPLTSEVHIKIGDLFEKSEDVNTALECYQTAISLGLPGTTSEAYERIGFINMKRRNYFAARSNFIECLKIQQCQSSPDALLVAISHICLAKIEHKTDHHQKRDFHIEQALMIADNDEQLRDFIMKQISSIQD